VFTGLVEERGRVARVEPRPGGRRLWIEARRVVEDTRVGDSLAISGCCLTAIEVGDGGFAVEAVPETLSRTTVGDWSEGAEVNLERSLRLDQRLGGHLVQGHVDGVGRVVEVRPEDAGRRVAFEVPETVTRFLAEKGSIAIDGVSLTLFECKGLRFTVALIPHTLAVTTLGGRRPGDRVNVEADILLKQIAAMLDSRRPGRLRGREKR